MFIFVYLFSLIFVGCASSSPQEQPGPNWIQQPTRAIENGYLIYTESEVGPSTDIAGRLAEGLALSDLANECSFVPRGTRIEGRYDEWVHEGTKSYIRVAVEYRECLEAQNANDPQAIRKLASQGFTEQLKSYQNLIETTPSADHAELPPPEQLISYDDFSRANPGETSNVNFYYVREYVTYQKQIVILAPGNYFLPQSPETLKFISSINPASQQIATVQKSAPTTTTGLIPWSRIPRRPWNWRPQPTPTPLTSIQNKVQPSPPGAVPILQGFAPSKPIEIAPTNGGEDTKVYHFGSSKNPPTPQTPAPIHDKPIHHEAPHYVPSQQIPTTTPMAPVPKKEPPIVSHLNVRPAQSKPQPRKQSPRERVVQRKIERSHEPVVKKSPPRPVKPKPPEGEKKNLEH